MVYRRLNKFQSTHPRGVRHAGARMTAILRDFNPRTHVGCDGVLCGTGLGVKISIHAPTWGATQCFVPMASVLEFQSTHPRGVRQRMLSRRSQHLHFNPRTHVGCDEFRQPPRWLFEISIHAPTWGATPVVRAVVGISNFNPRTHVGCDAACVNEGLRKGDFNPRTHVGCDSEC